MHRIALLYGAHTTAEADGIQNGDTIHGSAYRHFVGIGLRIAHGLLRAVALNLQNTHGSGGRSALQIVSFSDLGEGGLRFFQGLIIFLGVDARDDFIALHFELSFFEGILRLGQCGIVVRVAGAAVFVKLCVRR